MSESDFLFFNPADFASVTLTILFRNLTSRLDPLPPEQVALVEIAEQGLTLGLPRTSCNVKHSVELEIHRVDPLRGEPLVVRATGKIEAIEPADDPNQIRATVALKQFDEASWRDFRALNDARQQAINRFLNDARG
jgi:hypothetical protein